MGTADIAGQAAVSCNRGASERLRLKVSEANRSTFPFLKLAKEIRDQILLYALLCPSHSALMHPRGIVCHRIDLYRPPTPGLCLVSRQLRVEGNEVLYSQNTILFYDPIEFSTSLRVIGQINRDHICSIFIRLDHNTAEPDKGHHIRQSTMPSIWASTLCECTLGKLAKMHVSTDIEVDLPPSLYPTMDPALIGAIKDLFARDQGQQAVRSLRLTGFRESDRMRFPSSWKTTMAGFDLAWVNEPEVAGMLRVPPPQYLVHQTAVPGVRAQYELIMEIYQRRNGVSCGTAGAPPRWSGPGIAWGFPVARRRVDAVEPGWANSVRIEVG
ncbi:hypothetical protein MMC07_005263 [Pseudocyphellaria aurata]|nr:hypothetical protein [Pseudocyphellaria aurata]